MVRAELHVVIDPVEG